MTLAKLRARFLAWHSVEPRIDTWASYAALGVAALAAIALV